MTGQQAAEAELRALVGEAVGHLRLISENPRKLTYRHTKEIYDAAQRSLDAAEKLIDRLP
jgi:hypothetical protein